MLEPLNPGGAWELALRYSTLDLNDFQNGVFGGEEHNITAAVNWYPNTNIRFSSNVTFVNNDELATAGSPHGRLAPGDDFSYLQVRCQALF